MFSGDTDADTGAMDLPTTFNSVTPRRCDAGGAPRFKAAQRPRLANHSMEQRALRNAIVTTCSKIDLRVSTDVVSTKLVIIMIMTNDWGLQQWPTSAITTNTT